MLMNLLHEDVNRVSTKPYIEYPTYNVFDPSQSPEMWDYYLQRDNSRVIDLFYGQTITFIKCSQCGEQRVKYEPFSMLTLPLPPEKASMLVNIMDGRYSESQGIERYSESQGLERYSESQGLERYSKSQGIERPTEVRVMLKKSAPSSAILAEVASQLSLPERQIALYVEQNGRFETLDYFGTVSSLVDGYYSSRNLVAFIVGAEGESHV